MKKRVSRPRRFASVDNEAIDSLPSILAVGLLTRLIRAQDGEHVTVERLTQDYSEGEKSLSGAMRQLVEAAFVVKIKIQRSVTENVEDEVTGKVTVKRGGTWYTEFSVDSLAFTAEDVAEMVAEVLSRDNVKSYRVEPERLDPRATGLPRTARPTPRKGGVGPTCENTRNRPAPPKEGVGPTCENTDPRPTRPNRQVGRAGTTQRGALFKEETVVEDSLRGATRELSDGRQKREVAAPGNGPTGNPPAVGGASAADQVVDAYISAFMSTAGLPPRPDAVRSVRAAAEGLLSVGRSVGNLCTLAGGLGAKGWTDLVKHAQMNPEAAARPAAARKQWCGECNDGREPTSAAERMRETPDGWVKCHCHPGYVPKQPAHA